MIIESLQHMYVNYFHTQNADISHKNRKPQFLIQLPDLFHSQTQNPLYEWEGVCS